MKANAPVVSVKATQTVAGVTKDSDEFRNAFASAVKSLLPTGSSVTIVSVTVVEVRRRQFLTTAVSVVYTVQSTAPASDLTSTLSSGTAAMTAVLQQSYPAAAVAPPTVVTIANPTASPTTSPPVASSSTASSIVPGIVVGSVVGFIVLLSLISFRRHQLQKKMKNKILAEVMEQDNEKGGLDKVVDPKSTVKPTIQPVRKSLEELPFEDDNNKIATIARHGLGVASLDENDNVGLNISDETIEGEKLVNESITITQPSVPTTDVKFPFNTRSSLEVQGWFSSKGSSKQSSVAIDDGDDDDDGDNDVGDALVGKSHHT